MDTLQTSRVAAVTDLGHREVDGRRFWGVASEGLDAIGPFVLRAFDLGKVDNGGE